MREVGRLQEENKVLLLATTRSNHSQAEEINIFFNSMQRFKERESEREEDRVALANNSWLEFSQFFCVGLSFYLLRISEKTKRCQVCPRRLVFEK